MKHALVVTVAVAYFAVSVADGGYQPEALAAGTLVIWWAVIVALAVGAWPRAAVPRVAMVTGLCLAALAGLTALSIGWASDNGQAFNELVRVAGYTGLFALVLLASPAASARSWLLGLAFGLVGVAAIALGSRFEDALPWGESGIAELLPSARDRLSYPLGYWNALGACMALSVVLLVWAGGRGETRTGRALAIGALPPVLLTLYLTSSRGGLLAMTVGLITLIALGPARSRLLGGAVLGLAGGAVLVVAAGLRSPLIEEPETAAARFAGHEILLATLIAAAAIGVSRYLIDDPLQRLAVPRRVAQAAVVTCGVLVVGAVVAADPVQRFEDFRSYESTREPYLAEQLASGTSSGRYQLWSAAADAFASQPLRGIGAGGYETWWSQHGAIDRPLRDAHSLFVEMLAELGVLGLLAVCAFLALGAVHGWRRRSRGAGDGSVEVALALLAAGTLPAAIDWMWEIPAAFGVVVVAVALLVGPATAQSEGGAPRGGGPPGEPSDPGAPAGGRGSFGWGVATLLAGWVAVWIAAVLLLTEAKLSDSRAAVDRGDLGAAARDARDAATLQPWAAEPRLQLALVQEDAGALDAAQRSIEEAIERAREDWSGWYVAGRIQDSLGDEEAAEESFRRAAELNSRATLLARRRDAALARLEREAEAEGRGAEEGPGDDPVPADPAEPEP